MRIYFRLFNICALNFGAFYSAKYRRWYVQLIPVVLCMVVVIGRRLVPSGQYVPRDWHSESIAIAEEFGDQP
jgi:hypothetical protein